MAPGDNTTGSFNGVGTFTVGGNLTLSSSSALDFDITSQGQDLLVVGGTVSLGSQLTLNLADEYTPDGQLPTGHYNIISAADIVGFTPGTFAVTGVPTGDTYTLTLASNSALLLTVLASDAWTGAVNSTWDITTANWNTGNGTYGDGDAVLFDDRAVGSPGGGNVVVNGTVKPAAVTFANTTPDLHPLRQRHDRRRRPDSVGHPAAAR